MREADGWTAPSAAASGPKPVSIRVVFDPLLINRGAKMVVMVSVGSLASFSAL